MNNQKNTSTSIENLILTPVINHSLILFKIMIGVLISFLAIRNIYFDFIHTAYINNTFYWPIWPQMAQHIPRSMFTYLNLGTLLFGIQIARQKWGAWSYFGYLICYLPLFTFNYTYYEDYQLLLITICVLLSLTSHQKAIKSAQIQSWEILIFKLLFSSILLWRVIAYLNIAWLSGTTLKTVLAPTVLKNLLFSPSNWIIIAISISLPIFECCLALIPWKFPKLIPGLWIGLLLYFYTNIFFDSEFQYSQMPLLLFALSTLFLPADYPKNFIKKITQLLDKIIQAGKSISTPSQNSTQQISPTVKTLIAVYVIIQLIIPLNVYTILPNHKWVITYPTFSWSMKKQRTVQYGYLTLVNPTTKETSQIKPPDGVLDTPLTLLIYAHQLRDSYKSQYGVTPEIYAHLRKSINNRPITPYTNPEIDLSKVNYQFGKSPSWILPQPENYFK